MESAEAGQARPFGRHNSPTSGAGAMASATGPGSGARASTYGNTARNSYQQASVYAPAKHHVYRHWIFEGLSAFITLGIMATIYLIMASFDQHTVPDWPFSININTLVALLSTVMRSCMMEVVSEIISQLKWSWFSNPRPLSHLQDFENASRTITGAVKLLFIAPTNFLGVLGALVTIFSLGMGPFTQQAIRSVTCPQILPEMQASIPVSHYVPGYGGLYSSSPGTYDIPTDMKGVMVNGIVNPTGNDTAMRASCPTGNCTFSSHEGVTHSSIGLCSACIDTTSFVTEMGGGSKERNFSLPNGIWISPESDQNYFAVATGDLSWASSLIHTQLAARAGWAMTNVTVLSITNATCSSSPHDASSVSCPHNATYGDTPQDYVATSCALYPCLKNFYATLSQGVLDEFVTSTEVAPINFVEAGIEPEEEESRGLLDDVLGSVLDLLKEGLLPDKEEVKETNANHTAVKSPCSIDDKLYEISSFSTVPRIPGRSFTSVDIDGIVHSVPNECVYKMGLNYQLAMASFLENNLLKGSCVFNPHQGDFLNCGDQWWLHTLYNSKMATFDTLSTAFEQFTTVVTNKMRTTGATNDDLMLHEVVQGTVYQTTMCTEFNWPWLIMPTVLVVSTVAMLLIMIKSNVDDRNHPVWKSSVLPLLVYGFNHHQRGPRPVLDLAQMSDHAEITNATFQSGDDAGFYEHAGSSDSRKSGS
ncbi:hypothetical protein F4809DRAFT_592376 [Biscogniauxia mediterranea]|nr:hypothetical protein F4809DRAFT_592376 [Biscogniauxia mediterranea]